jgi:hypothetical protein
MDNFETHPSPSQPDPNHLQAEVDSLRHLMVSLLVLLIVISGTLNVYLLRQWRSSQTELKTLRGMVDQYNKEDLPQITNFVAKLTEYGQTHTNFVVILKRYGLDTLPTNTAAAATARPPAKAAKK